MRRRISRLCVWAGLCALAATGCERPAPSRSPLPTRAAPATPARGAVTVHTVDTVLTLAQGLLDAPGEVVVERRRRCQIAFDSAQAELRLVQSWPEQVRVRDQDLAWQTVATMDDGAAPRELPGHSLLRAWLPSAPVSANQRWTRAATLELAGQHIEVTHVTEVTRAAGGGLLVTTQAHGQRDWGETGIAFRVVGSGQALLSDGPLAWPTRIAITYRVRVQGGPSADVESSLGFELTVAEESRS